LKKEKGLLMRGISVSNKIVPLSHYMCKNTEQSVLELLSGFSCSKDKDVQGYLRNTAARHETDQMSRTYLIFDSEPTERLVAYVTVATKCLVLGDDVENDVLLKTMNVNNGVAQSYLIGQLGKVDGYSKKIGDLAMDFALEVIQSANKLVGCKSIRLDCKDALVDYYKKKGFKLLNKNIRNDLNRMVMILT